VGAPRVHRLSRIQANLFLLQMATGTNSLGFAIQTHACEYKTRPLKKTMTRDEFNFVPKPMPIGLMGTHVPSVGTKSNSKIGLYMYVHIFTI
jgi:hypothetical protein